MNSPWTGNLEWESMLRSEGETRRLVEKPLQTSAVMAAEVMNTDEPNLLSLFLALLYIYFLSVTLKLIAGKRWVIHRVFPYHSKMNHVVS